ncbi:MAG: potassium/proton antiporter [Bacteroidales bacterium]|nr:potassium/proton antiporter [Bacteroidales bacterium]
MNVSIESLLLLLSVLFLVSLSVSRVGSRFGIPALLLFLGVGMIFGAGSIYGYGIQFENYAIAQAIGTLALCVILFSGGLDTKYNDIKPVFVQGTILATLGVLLTALITGLFIYYVVNPLFSNMKISFLGALLLASVMSSTDSASVFSILRGKGVNLKNNLKPLLEFESGSNDPMAYMLTVVLIQLLDPGVSDPNYGGAVLSFFLQFGIGGIAGFVLGKFAVRTFNKIKLPNDSLYPVLLFACGIFTFAITYFIKGNGYLAIYIAGVVIGNAKFAHKKSSLQFFDGLAWLSQLVMFLTLGLLINLRDLLPVALGSLVIGVFMILGARPLSVFISLLPFRKMGRKDKFYVSWVGLRGAVPIIFATLPLAAGLPYSHLIFNIVFFITLMSLLVQGTTVVPVAKLLRLSKQDTWRKRLRDFNIENIGDLKSTITEITLDESILKKGNRLMDIPLPEHTLVTTVKRGEDYFIPKGDTILQPDDALLIITNNEEALAETYQNLGIDYRVWKKE